MKIERLSHGYLITVTERSSGSSTGDKMLVVTDEDLRIAKRAAQDWIRPAFYSEQRRKANQT